MRTLFCCLFAWLFFTVLHVSAEEAVPLAEKEGKWSFSMSDDSKVLSKERFKKQQNSLRDISAIITASAAMNPPKGFEARFWGSVTAKDRYDACSGKKCPPSRPTATLAMMLGRYEENNGKVKAAFNTPATMDISINNLGHLFANLPVLFKDAEGYLLPEPKPDGERAGMRTYANNGHAVAVMTSNDKPLWQPVSRERYLKAAIAAAAKSAGMPPKPVKKGKKQKAVEISGNPVMIEESRSWIDPAEEKRWVESSRSLAFEMKESVEVLQARLQKLQAELEAMPAEQRKMPARVEFITAADGESASLLAADSSAGVAVVTPDFRYFNQKLPFEVIQLLVVQWKFEGNQLYDPDKPGITETLNNKKLLETYKSMDWQKLRSKVTRTGP